MKITRGFLSRSSVGLLIVALVPASLLLPSRGATSAYAIRAPIHKTDVINVLLQAEARQIEREAHHFLRPNQAMPRVRVIVQSRRDVANAIRRLGGAVSTDVRGRITTASVPVDRLSALARLEGVLTLYPSEQEHLLLDRSVPEIKADQVWRMTDSTGNPIQGKHVLVGIVDSGIDYHNADFQNPDGSTRIKFIWDQTHAGSPTPSGFKYGYECTSASINDGSCAEADTDGHGTHVAGIAAGNGRSDPVPQEIGVAPQADIAVVKWDMDSSHSIDAWNYLIQKANQLHEPLVVNNSWGNQLSPHDGSDPVSIAADSLAAPGRIFVAAAGNEAHQGLHESGHLGQGQRTDFALNELNQGYESTMGLFYPARDAMSFTITDTTTGDTVGPVRPGDSADYQKTAHGSITISVDSGSWDSRYQAVMVKIDSADGNHLHDHYSLTLTGDSVTDSGFFNAWLQEDGVASFANADESDTIAAPADSHDVIAVGNYVTRTDWTDESGASHTVCEAYACPTGNPSVGSIDPASSTGPTEDGRQKPDIASPGTMIISSVSSQASVCSAANTSDTCLPPQLITPGGHHLIESGTSMSSPHVAGAIALALQVTPSLGQQAVTSLIRATARHDQFTGTAPWTPAFGAGKLDALALVEAAVAPPIKPTATAMPTNTPTPTKTPTGTPGTATEQNPTATPKPKAKKRPKHCRKGQKLVHGKCVRPKPKRKKR